ncbi:MAG: hypothetical protein U1E70_11980 [Acetobacteraceae bacterium]
MSATPADRDAVSMPALLVSTLLSYLSPLFLGGAAGNDDAAAARTMAADALKIFHIGDVWELLLSAQTVAFGMAALGSINLSMRPDLTPALALRARGNAGTLHRAAMQCRGLLEQHRPAVPTFGARTPVDLAAAQAEAMARIASVARRMGVPPPDAGPPSPPVAPGTVPPLGIAAASNAAETVLAATPSAARPPGPAMPVAAPVPPPAAPGLAMPRQAARVAKASAGGGCSAAGVGVPSPAAAPKPSIGGRAGAPQPTPRAAVQNAARALASGAVTPPNLPDGMAAPMPDGAESLRRRAWAGAMLKAATECAAELPGNTPDRRLNSLRVAALTNVAHSLLNGDAPPDLAPFRLPSSMRR